MLECAFRVRPLDERLAVSVAEAHPASVVDEDVHVRTSLAGRLDGFVRNVDNTRRHC